MLAAQIADDCFVHPVSANADRPRINNVTQRKYGHLGCTPANVHNHVTRRVRYGHACTDGCRNRLGDQAGAARSSAQNRLADCAFFNGRRPMRYTHDNLRLGKRRALVDLANKGLDHRLSDIKIRYDAFAHGADRLDAARCAAQHKLRILTNGQHFLLSVLHMVRDNRRFIQNNAFALDVDKRVRRPQVDRHVCRKKSTEGHALCPNSSLSVRY